MNFDTQFNYWKSLMTLSANIEVKKTLRMTEANYKSRFHPNLGSFQKICEDVFSLHEAGLTRLRDIKKHTNGQYQEITFDQLFTQAGEALLKDPPRFELSEDTKKMLKERLERQIYTGTNDSPLVTGTGEPIDGLTLSSFMSPEQIKEIAKQQLKLLQDSEQFDKAKQEGKPTD